MSINSGSSHRGPPYAASGTRCSPAGMYKIEPVVNSEIFAIQGGPLLVTNGVVTFLDGLVNGELGL